MVLDKEQIKKIDDRIKELKENHVLLEKWGTSKEKMKEHALILENRIAELELFLKSEL